MKYIPCKLCYSKLLIEFIDKTMHACDATRRYALLYVHLHEMYMKWVMP